MRSECARRKNRLNQILFTSLHTLQSFPLDLRENFSMPKYIPLKSREYFLMLKYIPLNSREYFSDSKNNQIIKMIIF